MVNDGAFDRSARRAIVEAGMGRCVGCGHASVTCQHRRPRGMGGTRNVAIGSPANGVPLCGDGVRGCHGWAESQRADATLMGWLLAAGEDPTEAPWWHRTYGWVRWHIEDDGCPVIALVDELFIDRIAERVAAVERHRWWLNPLPM